MGRPSGGSELLMCVKTGKNIKICAETLFLKVKQVVEKMFMLRRMRDRLLENRASLSGMERDVMDVQEAYGRIQLGRVRAGFFIVPSDPSEEDMVTIMLPDGTVYRTTAGGMELVPVGAGLECFIQNVKSIVESFRKD